MKKVLIIANLFHASPRMPGLATYLSELNWQTAIVTPPLGKEFKNQYNPPEKFFAMTKIIEVPYRGDVLWLWRGVARLLGFNKNASITEQIKGRIGLVTKKSFIDKMLIFYQAIFGYPDTEKYWIKPAIKTIKKILKYEKFDAIVSSSPYPTSHLIAARIKNKFLIPWIADFRDPWSQNHDYPYGQIRKFLDTRLEKKIISTANAIVAASPSYAQKEEELLTRSVTVITNGFDPGIFNYKKCPLTKKFTVIYTGNIYAQKQDPIKLLCALKKLIEERKINQNNIEINFFGEKLVWLNNEIAKLGLKNVVHQYNRVPREEILKKQSESQVLLLLCWEDKKEKGVYPKKTFEYLAAQRPILATGGSQDEDVKKIIAETKAGESAITIEEIKEKILGFYKEYEEKGAVSYHGNIQKINEYSYKGMAQKFAEILNKITK